MAGTGDRTGPSHWALCTRLGLCIGLGLTQLLGMELGLTAMEVCMELELDSPAKGWG